MNEQTMFDFVNKIADDDKVSPFQNGFVVLSNEEMVRYTVLIVEECIQTLSKRFIGDLNREDMEVRRCIDDVKKHFGVEE